MNCEQLRIQKNRAYIEYEKETDPAKKMAKQRIWKQYCLMYEDAYQREVKGEIPQDGSNLGTKERCLVI